MPVSEWEFVVRLLVGAVMGGAIGFEREAHGRPAGFRTHLLVCLSAVLIMIISHNHFKLNPANPLLAKTDPGRIVSGAVTGIGFLGAGVIIKTKGTVYGLTTAACIWIVFAIGLAVGSGLYVPAVTTFLLTFLTLWTLRLAERKIPKVLYRRVEITADDVLSEEQLRAIIDTFGHVIGIEYEKDNATRSIVYNVSVALRHDTPLKQLFKELCALVGAKSVKIGLAF